MDMSDPRPDALVAVAGAGMPVVMAYTVFLYWKFKGGSIRARGGPATEAGPHREVGTEPPCRSGQLPSTVRLGPARPIQAAGA